MILTERRFEFPKTSYLNSVILLLARLGRERPTRPRKSTNAYDIIQWEAKYSPRNIISPPTRCGFPMTQSFSIDFAASYIFEGSTICSMVAPRSSQTSTAQVPSASQCQFVYRSPSDRALVSEGRNSDLQLSDRFGNNWKLTRGCGVLR